MVYRRPYSSAAGRYPCKWESREVSGSHIDRGRDALNSGSAWPLSNSQPVDHGARKASGQSRFFSTDDQICHGFALLLRICAPVKKQKDKTSGPGQRPQPETVPTLQETLYDSDSPERSWLVSQPPKSTRATGADIVMESIKLTDPENDEQMAQACANAVSVNRWQRQATTTDHSLSGLLQLRVLRFSC
jgi:hypothetical protein